MSLSIPDDARCLVPGCTNDPELSLSMRARYRDTTAAWAPEMHAYLCKPHALGGADISVTFRPHPHKQLDSALVITTQGVAETKAERYARIRQDQ